MNQEETDNTFEQIKQNLLRISEMQERSSADFEKWRLEADKRAAEADKRAAEADKRLAEADKRAAEADKRAAELDKKIKELTENVGGISKSNGAMAEETIYNSLAKNMIFAGIEFEDIIRNQKKHRKSVDIKGEYDVVMINGTMLAIIETKYKVREKDVSKLIDKKVGDFKILFPEYSNHKILLGIGGMSFEDNAEQEANDNGIGIIKIVGDTVEFYTEGIKVY